MSEIAEFLRARYAERRALAEAAKPGPWHSDGGSVYATHHTDEIIDYSESADHIAANDPAFIIADLDAKLAVVDELLGERHEVVDDCWYTCAAATEELDGGENCDEDKQGGPCDCGRDARVTRRLAILARPFAGHPDHKGEEWTP